MGIEGEGYRSSREEPGVLARDSAGGLPFLSYLVLDRGVAPGRGHILRHFGGRRGTGDVRTATGRSADDA